MKYPVCLSIFNLFRGLFFSLWLLAILNILEYSALSEATMKLTGEEMGKIVNKPQSD